MQEKIVPIVTEVVKLEPVVEFCDRVVDRLVQTQQAFVVDRKV